MAMTSVRGVRRSPRVLQRELATIESGISLVAAGGADRVVLAGLRFAERLLHQARELADSAGVEVALDRSPGARAAIVVSRTRA